MSVPPDQLSQILQGGLLNGQPQSNGLMNGNPFDQWIMNGSPSMQLGAQLAANAAPGKFIGLLGKSILGTQDAQQRNAQQQLALLSDVQQQQKNKALLDTVQALMQQDPSQQNQQNPATSPTASPWMAQAGGGLTQSGAPSQIPQQRSSQPQQAPSWLNPPTATDIQSQSIGGMNPRALAAYNMLMGKDPLAAQKEIRDQQLAAAQQQYAPQIARLMSVVQSDSPKRDVQADPQLMATWQHYAVARGLNPQTDFGDQNVRQVFSGVANAFHAGLSQSIEKPPEIYDTHPTGLGGSYQTERTTGKVSPGAPQQETAQFVTPDGGVKMMTKAQGMARGLQPYNPQTFVNTAAISPQAHAIATYRQPAPTAMFLKSAQGQELMKQVYAENPNYDATQYATKQSARKAFATGKDGNTVRSLSVATDHLDQLDKAADELQNVGIQAANKVANFFSQQTGNPAVTNFNAMKNVVADEVVKAVVGSGGGVGDRDKAQQDFSAANSPQQLRGVIQKYKGLMGGQLNGLRRQYEKTTGLSDFDEYLSDQARGELGSSSAAPGRSSSPSVTANPVRVNSLADALKLAPGTVFLTPDGRLKVR